LFANDGFPPGPLYGVFSCLALKPFRRAKFEQVSQFPPGHWALGVQSLLLVRFQIRA